MSGELCQFGRCLPARFGGDPSPAKFRLWPGPDVDLAPGAPTHVVTCAQCLAPAIDCAPSAILVEVIR